MSIDNDKYIEPDMEIMALMKIIFSSSAENEPLLIELFNLDLALGTNMAPADMIRCGRRSELVDCYRKMVKRKE